MHIRRIQISNVRGFHEVDLDLGRPDGSLAGWTVLAGRNGSGKSTLLQALALAVGGGETLPLTPGLSGWVRSSARSATAKVTAELPGEADPSLRSRQASVRWPLDDAGGGPKGVSSLHRFFLAAYGPFRRLSGHATDAQRLMEGPPAIARVVSLFREDSSLLESVTWLREIYLQRLEKKAGASELQDAVLALLDDGLLPDGAGIDGFDSDGLWVVQHGVRLPLRELSDGYRTVAALVMDIVRHFHRAFGKLNIRKSGDVEGPRVRVLHPGVILIDEVDLHLHVTWQKRIGFWLKNHFPNVQFIVTTHSPFVCQAADPSGLIRMPAPGEDRSVEHVSEELYRTVVHGSIDDAVLTELFGLESLYSTETDRLRDEVARLEAEAQTGKATKKDLKSLSELRSRLPRTMSSSVEQTLRSLSAKG